MSVDPGACTAHRFWPRDPWRCLVDGCPGYAALVEREGVVLDEDTLVLQARAEGYR